MTEDLLTDLIFWIVVFTNCKTSKFTIPHHETTLCKGVVKKQVLSLALQNILHATLVVNVILEFIANASTILYTVLSSITE